MRTAAEETTAPPSSFRLPWGRRSVILALSFAAVAAVAYYGGTLSRPAAAAPEPVLRSPPPAALTLESQRLYPANADADVGPGQAEPVLVGSP
jgi:hypothetical protein